MHEHYDGFTLINMKFTVSECSAKLCLSNAERCELGEANGRLYAPIIGRMLQPDIVIQDQYNSQAYNAYSYCLNNPLRFTDPSGYVVNDANPPFYFMLLNPNKYLLKAMGVEPSTVEYNTEYTQGKQRNIIVKWIYDGYQYEATWVHHGIGNDYQSNPFGCQAFCEEMQERRFWYGNKGITEEYMLSLSNIDKGTETSNSWMDYMSNSYVFEDKKDNDLLYDPSNPELKKHPNFGSIEKFTFNNMMLGNGVSFHYRNENETFYHCVNASDAIKYHDGRFNYDIYNVGIWESIKKIGGYKTLDIKRVALIHILKLMHRP